MTSRYLLGTIKIVIFSLIAVIATLVFFALFNGQSLPFNFAENKEPNVLLQDVTIEENINNVNLEWYSGGVVISKSYDDKIHFKERSTEKLNSNKWASAEVVGNTLNLKSNNKYNFVLFFFQSPATYLELRLPDKQYESFRMLMTSGNTTISDFEISDVDITITSGNLYMFNIQSQRMTINMTSGNSNFQNTLMQSFDLTMTSGNTDFEGIISEECRIDMTSGNLNLTSTTFTPRIMNVNMTSGDADITLSKDYGFVLKLDKTSGNVDLDNEIEKVSESEYTYYNKEYNINVDMTSGSFDLNLH